LKGLHNLTRIEGYLAITGNDVLKSLNGQEERLMDRRKFLKTGGAGALAGLTGIAWGQEEALPRIRRYRRLGRTGIEMSDISLGSYGGISPGLIARAFDLGVNYFDTAPDYRGNGLVSEESIGAFFHVSSRRQQVAIATKMCAARNYPAHWPLHTPTKHIIAGVEDSLRRLRTDYADVLLLHGVGELGDGDTERIKDPEVLEAFAQLRKAGKARFLGMGCHGPRKMAESVEWAVDSGHYDVVQVAYNFFSGTSFNFRQEGLDRVLEKARQQDVGVIAMKAQAGAKPEDVARITRDGTQFSHACFKWVLSSPNISGILVTVKNFRQLEEYVSGSGQPVGLENGRLLRQYVAAFGSASCRIGCGACLHACPHQVEIPTVLRYQVYHDAYGARETARQAYASLSPARQPLACASCSAPCASSCPHGLDVRSLLLQARNSLDPEVA